jgi:hypothetical protein
MVWAAGKASTNPAQVTITTLFLLSLALFPSYPPPAALISIRDADVDFATGEQETRHTAEQALTAFIQKSFQNTQDLTKKKAKIPVIVINKSKGKKNKK